MPAVVFQVGPGIVVVKSKVWFVERAGLGAQVTFKGLQDVQVWAVMRGARRRRIKGTKERVGMAIVLVGGC